MQGGFIPDVILYLSYFYTTSEREWPFLLRRVGVLIVVAVPLRLAWFWVSNYAATLIGAFMATGILRLRSATGTAGWKWLFLIEGLLTLVVGIMSFFLMPPSPTQTKAWFRPKGWFNERFVTPFHRNGLH